MNKKLITTLLTSLLLISCTKTLYRENETRAYAYTGKKPQLETQQTSIQQLLTAELAIQRKQYETAYEYYNQVAKQSKDPKISKRAAELAYKLKQPEAALEHLKNWLKNEPNNLSAQHMILTQLIQLEYYEETTTYWEKITKKTEQNAIKTLTLIQAMSLKTDPEKIYKSINAYLEQNQTDTTILYAQAWLASQLEKYKEALTHIDKYIQNNPKQKNAYLLKIDLIDKALGIDKAIEILESELKKHPKQWETRLHYAKILTEQNRYKEALKQFKKVEKLKPNHPEALLGLALLSTDLEKYTQAEKHLLQLLKTNPQYQNTALYYLGTLAEQQKKEKEAIEYYQKVSMGHNYLTSKLRMSYLIAKQGEIEKAREFLHSIITMSELDKEKIILTEIELLEMEEKWEESIKIINEGLKKMPGNMRLLYTRALIHEKLDNLNGLEEDLKTILDKDPDNANALNALGYTLADRTTRYEEALTYITKAIKISPENPAIIDSLGWVKYRLGEYKLAIELFKKALKNNEPEENYEIKAHLIEALYKNGEEPEATELWDKTIKKEPNNRHLKQIKHLFTNNE